jgi:hypothetical protein
VRRSRSDKLRGILSNPRPHSRQATSTGKGRNQSPKGSKGLPTRTRSAGLLRQPRPPEREMGLVPVVLSNGSPPDRLGRGSFMGKVLEKFCPRFTPGGTLLALDDGSNAVSYLDQAALERLGVVLPERRTLPNAIIHHAQRDSLVLVEAATIHGPINQARRRELQALFQGATPNLVFVTTFSTRGEMAKHLGDIDWETEAWVADSRAT